MDLVTFEFFASEGLGFTRDLRTRGAGLPIVFHSKEGGLRALSACPEVFPQIRLQCHGVVVFCVSGTVQEGDRAQAGRL